MTPRRPVTDWMRDFDHCDPRWNDEPFPLWAEMREKGDVAVTERYRGAYCPLSWAGVRHAASSSDDFSSRHVEVRGEQTLPPDFAPPITSDPPLHRAARALLAPAFSNDRIAALETDAREDCRSLLADIASFDEVDAVVAYARPAIARTLSRLLGLGAGDIVAFQSASLVERLAFVRSAIDEARATRIDGLVGRLVRAADEGEMPDRARLLGHIYLLLVASLDTTAAVLSGALLHLADEPHDRAWLRARPDRMPQAVEEFLRFYAPVSVGRVVTRDTHIGECPVEAGRMVLLAFPAANRDPARFPDPDSVLLARKIASHAAFGFGIHHCIGARLARMLITVGLDEWMASVPEFGRADRSPLEWTPANVRGLRHLRLWIDRGRTTA